MLLLVPLLLTGWLAIVLIPAGVLAAPSITVTRLTSVSAAIGVALRAAGEEAFFRGLLGGVLMRRLEFTWRNLPQAALFLIPHLTLLLIDSRSWPILPVQFVAALLLGWLRYEIGAFVPGAAVHAIANLTAGHDRAPVVYGVVAVHEASAYRVWGHV